MTPAPLLEIRDLHFAFGTRVVLDGISLTVPAGQVTAILGPSGCGKTSLLKLIGGQLKPTRGEVRFAGKVVHEQDTDNLYALRRGMGMMQQQGGLFSDLSVFENIAFPMRERTRLPEDIIFDLVMMKLDAVGLRGAHGLFPNELSGGMARRVALARAIALDPQLIMYDEPFSGLDPISLNVVAELIARLNAALSVTSIIVTYDVSESLKVADYIAVMSEGRIVAHGPTAEMRECDEPFVRQFLHALPDGPVAFHYPAPRLNQQLDLA